MPSNVPIIAYTYTAAQSVGGNLLRKYPFLRARIFGQSVCGRNLCAYTLGTGQKCTLFAAAFHGQEWITSYIALKLLSQLCNMYEYDAVWYGKSVRGILKTQRIVLVPCVNPDGVEIALHGISSACEFEDSIEKISNGDLHDWNANARGVDINHNFDAGWDILRSLEVSAGINGPAPRRYGGPYPNSEPETRAIVKITHHEKPSHVFAFHSQGEEIFWEYNGISASGSENFARALAEESGYELVKNGGLASHGGYKDWFIKEFCRPGFTLEFGKGKNPLSLTDFDMIYTKAEKMLLLAALMGENYGTQNTQTRI
ncbi:MAG: M14 family metallocarboxypeptidase [Oscillospiraceae bacterium]|jgi:g-D-glutamyl-meso-diaminopimelate peptidase|nr:M14 family metallocarboxypeptidase [Oscillospiraceae bacterium]